MTRDSTVKEKFAAMSTESLILLWEKDDRMAWAEDILHTELISRGINQSDLDSIVSRREEIYKSRAPSERETIIEYGILGRFVALVCAMMLGTLLSNTLGPKVAVLAVVSIAIAYIVVFSRRVALQLKNPTSGLGSVFMIYQCLELAFIGIVSIIALWLTLTTNV
jgi:hypothetical protein